MSTQRFKEHPSGRVSVTASVGGSEFESGLMDAGRASQLGKRVQEAEWILKAAEDPHVKDLLDIVTLPPGVRPSKPELMMAVAHLMALRSTCARLQVGCVVTDLGMTQILSVGYNGNYAGGPNECDSAEAGACGCLHAEDNALVKLKSELKNLMLFTTHSPCVACSKRIANQGNIRTVWFDQRYRDEAGLEILRTSDVQALPR